MKNTGTPPPPLAQWASAPNAPLTFTLLLAAPSPLALSKPFALVC